MGEIMMRAARGGMGPGIATAAMSAMAASTAAQPVEPDVPVALLNGFHNGGHIEDYVARVVGELRREDRAGDGLDQSDIDFAMTKRAAVRRAGPIQRILPMNSTATSG